MTDAIPTTRFELESCVSELADPTYPERCWKGRDTAPGETYGFAEYVDYFVIDNDFIKDPAYYIGKLFRDAQEASVISDLSRRISEFTKLIGYYAQPSEVLNHPLWPSIVDVAKHARDVLTRKE
jgi:hypothetical protein